jgi:tetratricopeptide (TPR) repeat protein
MRLAAFALLALARVAAAQAPSEGAKLFEQGRELAKQNKYSEACAKFEQSYALDNGVGTELNLADCHEHLGHVAQAWRMFDDAAQRSSDNAARQKFAKDRADALASKLATAVVNVPEPDAAGLSITVAGRAVKASATITERVDPGSINVHAATPTKTLFDATKDAAAGATVIFDLPGVPALVEHHDEVAPPQTTRRHSRVLWSYAVGGAGVLAVATGVVIGLEANSAYKDATDPKNGCVSVNGQLTCPAVQRQKALDAGSLADLGTVIGVVGAAALVTGIVLYATAPKDLAVAPMATNQSAGVAISGRF